MAWATTPTLWAAINSSDREPVTTLRVWENGDDQPPSDWSDMLVDWTISRTPDDTPEQVSRMAGSIAAQLDLTIGRVGPVWPDGSGDRLSRDYSPYVGRATGWRDRDYGVGVKVELRTGFRTSAGVEDLPVFFGRVDVSGVSDSGLLTLRCLDYCADLQADADIPPLVVADGSPDLPVYAVVEWLLRKGGFYRVYPTLPDAVLSVPALIPVVGQVAAPVLTGGSGASGGWTRYPAPSYQNTYLATDSYAPRAGMRIAVEGRFRSTTNAGIYDLVAIASEGTGQAGLRVWIDTTGAVRIGWLDKSVSIGTGSGAWPSDTAWHYLYVDVTHTATGTDWYVRIDSTTRSGSTSTSLKAADNGSWQISLGGLVHEGVSVSYQAPTTRTLRDTWTPTYQTDLLGTSPGIRAIPRGQTGTVLDLIRSIATGTGAVFRWQEDGVWRWQERASWMERRLSATVGDADETRVLIKGGFSYDGKSRRSEVTIDYATYRPQRSTATAPVWSASDVIIVPAMRTTTMDFDTEQPIIGLLPVVRTSLLTASNSTIQTVPAYQVGDPAAQNAAGIAMRLMPTATGFRAIIRNSAAQDIAFWDPTTGNPAFAVQGWTVVGGEPQIYTAKGSPRSREALTVPSSPWRQKRTEAAAMCDAIAAETSLPAVVFDSQEVVSNYAWTVDDVIRIRAPEAMVNLENAQIIGQSGNATRQTYTVRACWPPTGWVLGVNGRSNLDASTTLVA